MAYMTLAAHTVINDLDAVKVRIPTVRYAQEFEVNPSVLWQTGLTLSRVRTKTVGPGNIFVSMTKREVFRVVGIDGIYDPTHRDCDH